MINILLLTVEFISIYSIQNSKIFFYFYKVVSMMYDD